MVVKYLYDKFPSATSHQLSLPRSKVICAASLAFIAVNRLDLHKMLLVDNVELSIAIDVSVSILSGASGEEIIQSGWKFDPPKALSDVFESVIGAVLVDSGYDYEKTVSVLEHVMSDVLDPLSPSVTRDPVSDLICWMASAGCTSISFQYVIFSYHFTLK
jgi:endoribonuclease Dicer